jgi:hypothetical protein
MPRFRTAFQHSRPKRKGEFIEPKERALLSNLAEGPDWTYEVHLEYRAIGVKTRGETILYLRNHNNFNKRFRRSPRRSTNFPPTSYRQRSCSRGRIWMTGFSPSSAPHSRSLRIYEPILDHECHTSDQPTMFPLTAVRWLLEPHS